VRTLACDGTITFHADIRCIEEQILNVANMPSLNWWADQPIETFGDLHVLDICLTFDDQIRLYECVSDSVNRTLRKPYKILSDFLEFRWDSQRIQPLDRSSSGTTYNDRITTVLIDDFHKTDHNFWTRIVNQRRVMSNFTCISYLSCTFSMREYIHLNI